MMHVQNHIKPEYRILYTEWFWRKRWIWVSVIVNKKNFHVNMCLILNGYPD